MSRLLKLSPSSLLVAARLPPEGAGSSVCVARVNADPDRGASEMREEDGETETGREMGSRTERQRGTDTETERETKGQKHR